MMIKTDCWLLLFFLFFAGNGFAQNTIVLKNPSFEQGAAVAGTIPWGWEICGGLNETPPDVHAGMTRHYGVKHSPKSGKKYLGMVVRSNFTHEGIQQKLVSPLEKNKTYKLSLYVARSESYNSVDRSTGKRARFITPAIIRIWGVKGKCSTKELLYESEAIEAVDWKKLSIILKPEITHHKILIEAFYDEMVADPYNGNILLDAISAITEVVE